MAPAPPVRGSPARWEIAAGGANTRTARLRRKLSIAEVPARIGVGRHVIGDSERGKPPTGVAIHAGLLRAMGLADRPGRVADPLSDEESLTLAKAQGRDEAGRRKARDDDFRRTAPGSGTRFRERADAQVNVDRCGWVLRLCGSAG